jgi:hypothetical protein
MKMEWDREKQELRDKIARCNRLAREFPGITNKNLRDLEAELEQQVHDLDRHPGAPSARRY